LLPLVHAVVDGVTVMVTVLEIPLKTTSDKLALQLLETMFVCCALFESV
jgi:hypothetical protein